MNEKRFKKIVEILIYILISPMALIVGLGMIAIIWPCVLVWLVYAWSRGYFEVPSRDESAIFLGLMFGMVAELIWLVVVPLVISAPR